MNAILLKRFAVRAVEWIGWSFALNLVWEIAQLPLYAFPQGTPVSSITFAVAHCTLGDATLALVAYVAGAVATRRTAWPIERPAAGLFVVLGVTLGWTVWAEWNAVYVARAWAYGGRCLSLAASVCRRSCNRWCCHRLSSRPCARVIAAISDASDAPGELSLRSERIRAVRHTCGSAICALAAGRRARAAPRRVAA